MVKKPMTELPCPFPDCFSCPHPDCIRGSVAGHERPRRTSNAKRGAARYAPLAGLTPEERKAHDKARRKLVAITRDGQIDDGERAEFERIAPLLQDVCRGVLAVMYGGR